MVRFEAYNRVNRSQNTTYIPILKLIIDNIIDSSL